MTKEEAESALGKAVVSIHADGETWQYERTVQGICLRYEGEKCAEYESKQETATFYFSPSRHLTYPFEGEWLSKNCYAEPFYSTYYYNVIPH